MNTFQLECFLSVAEHLNFARAAEQLSITQPAVTHQIRSLEQELNTKLFRRTTRSVSLTSAGILFLDDARQMLQISIRAKNRFRLPSGQDILPFPIGCQSHSQLQLLPPILRRLTEEFPNLHPQLRVVPFQHLYRLLEDEQVDVIISFQEPDSRKVPGNFLELGRLPVACLCSPDNPLAQKGRLTLSDLETQKLIMVNPLRSPEPLVQIQGMLMSGRSPQSVYFCESADTAAVLAQAGMGVCILPFPPAVQSEKRLCHIALDGIPPVCYGLYYKSLSENEPLKCFVKLMKELFKEYGTSTLPPLPEPPIPE